MDQSVPPSSIEEIISLSGFVTEGPSSSPPHSISSNNDDRKLLEFAKDSTPWSSSETEEPEETKELEEEEKPQKKPSLRRSVKSSTETFGLKRRKRTQWSDKEIRSSFRQFLH
jgi:hypothetical protein